VRDDRLFRVLVLGGLGLVGATSSVMACSSETPRPEGPPMLHVEGPPPPRDTATETPVDPTATATATSSVTATPTVPDPIIPPHEGPPPPRPNNPIPPS